MDSTFMRYSFEYDMYKFQLFNACINGDESLVIDLITQVSEDLVNCEVLRLSDIVEMVDDHVIGFSPLHFAAEYGNINLCQILLHFKADVNKYHGMGTPLDLAMLHDHELVFDFLIKNGANVNAIIDSMNAFHILFQIGCYSDDDVIKKWTLKLIQEGCDVNKLCFGRLRPLQVAPDFVRELLIENGAME